MKMCLTLSEIFTFYVVYGTLRLLQKAGKVAKVGNFGSAPSRGADGTGSGPLERAISQLDSKIPGLPCLLANATKDDVISCPKTIRGLIYDFYGSP